MVRRPHSVRGNAVFYVLIAVVMFAALTFAVTRNWRMTGNMASEEQVRLRADEMIAYGNGLRPIISRMTLLGRVSDTDIWFPATGTNATYGVVGAHTAQEVFNAAGGTATYQSPPSSACVSASCTYDFSGQYTITGVGTSAPELVMLVNDVDSAVCQRINKALNTGWSTVPTGGTQTTLARFDGSTYGAATAITLTGASNEFVGKHAFCYRETGGGQRYIFIYVLRAR